jgi:hypothetical protein
MTILATHQNDNNNMNCAAIPTGRKSGTHTTLPRTYHVGNFSEEVMKFRRFDPKALQEQMGLSFKQAKVAEQISGKKPNARVGINYITKSFGEIQSGIDDHEVVLQACGANVIVRIPNEIIERRPSWIVYQFHCAGLNVGAKASFASIYIGTTTRGLMTRVMEHFKEALSGSRVRFKRYLRGEIGALQPNHVLAGGDVIDRTTDIVVTVKSYGFDGGFNKAIEVETTAIKTLVKDRAGKTLEENMGGIILNTSLNSGVFAQRVKAITGKTVTYEKAEEEYTKLVYEGRSWMGDVERTIGTVCNNPHNFTVDEVEQLTMFRDMGLSQQETANVMRCSLRRVQDFFNRKTYQFLQLPEAA